MAWSPPTPVTGVFWQDVQPVSSDGLTDAQLRADPLAIRDGFGDLVTDAWGVPKASLPISLLRGMWTFDMAPKSWFLYENGVQVYTSTNIVSTNGAGGLTTSAAKTALILESRLSPRYQPNRGHLFSTALWCPSKTADGVREWGVGTTENRANFRLKPDGLLYAVLRSGNVETEEVEIVAASYLPDFDVEKGNVYDIQYQWRGVGNYKFYINLTLVHTIQYLGTLTALSVENPALPVRFSAERTTADVSMFIGCADVSSENGTTDSEQMGVAYAEAVSTTGTDKPVLVVHNPLLINGVTNTRTISLRSISVINTKKSTFKLWRTRTLADITGATLVAIGDGSFVQADSTDMDAGAVRATAATVANMEFITAIFVEAGSRQRESIGVPPTLTVSLVRGDYLVVTCTGTTAASDIVLTWGEEV